MNQQRIASAVLAVGAGLAFAWLYGGFVVETLRASVEKPPHIDPGVVLAAVGLTAIVTSALAAWFRVTFPADNRLRAGVTDLGTRLAPGASGRVTSVVGWIYFLVYFGMAGWAGYAWKNTGSDLTPQVLKDLVAFASGAAAVIVAKLFNND